MDELVRWLGEQLDEDERIARAAIEAAGDVPGAANWRFGNAYTDADEEVTYWQITTMTPKVDGFGPVELVGCGMSGGGAHEPEIARHAVAHDPARVLREINAKRQTLGFLVEEMDRTDNPWWYDDKMERILKLLALPYADRPGYKAEEWAP